MKIPKIINSISSELDNISFAPKKLMKLKKFGRQDSHSGGHFTYVPLLPPPSSNFQNLGKTQVLAFLLSRVVGKPRDNYRSCNSYGVSPQFLQPFSIDSADFPCRDPAISSPRSFYGQNICSVS
jgi:hypothetical protein